MCLAAFALGVSERFPLVVVSNRDEFHERPSLGLSWWPRSDDGTQVLAGRDLKAGGTWMGLSTSGRLALLTNIRAPGRQSPDAPSRGAIVSRWLHTRQRVDRFWMGVALGGYNGFNLVAADFRVGDCHWMSSDEASPRRLVQGVFGLSNGRLDEPWPKVSRIKMQLESALARADVSPDARADELAARLLAALSDPRQASDDQLPATGVPLELERQLSAVHIQTPDDRYGTRCSTVLITEQAQPGGPRVTTVWERSFSAKGQAGAQRLVNLPDWPPVAADDALLLPLGEQRDAARAHRVQPPTPTPEQQPVQVVEMR